MDEEGEPIEVVDRLADRLGEIARRQRDEPLAFIANRELFGDLVTREIGLDAVPEALVAMGDGGAAGVTVIRP